MPRSFGTRRRDRTAADHRAEPLIIGSDKTWAHPASPTEAMRVFGGTIKALSDALDADDIADIKRFASKIVPAYHAIGD